ncbi:MAG: transketolase-like TK C-terminal-containing protein, partial [Verrucomicrobiia bacterium]
LKQRESLDGFVPTRTVGKERLELPAAEIYKELHGGSKSAVSTTMAFVRLLTKLLDDKNIGDRIVPIIPDEARTFGMDSLFRRHGIYNSAGQNYEPVDRSNLLYYREATDGQILEEGISESGAMSSFLAAGVSYSSVGKVMVPFYIFYSMFGFQRIGDLAWAGGDMRARGFLLGATAGRTTLNGEGLQHQDGHGHLLAATYPHVLSYDPAFGYEVAVIVEDGMRRMYADDEDLIYYITLQNENYPMPAKPEGSETGILNGLYKFKPGPEGLGHRVQIFGSGSILNEALRAQQILAEQYDVSADVWSATSYKALRAGALEAQRWNMLHPGEEPRKSYLETTLEAETGPFIAVSDCMKLVSDQIAPWVPDGLFSLGTDGFGRSETREALRRFFEVDAESTVVASLYALSLKGSISPETVSQAMNKFGISPDKSAPVLV